MAGDEKMIQSWPLPTTDGHDAPFWEAARRGVLSMEVCSSCGKLRFPPRPMCPSCHSRRREWREISGRGQIWSFTVPHPPLLPAFHALAPYNVVVVELEEEPAIRLVGNLVEASSRPINGVSGDSIRIGEPVQAVFVRVADDVSLIRWVRRR